MGHIRTSIILVTLAGLAACYPLSSKYPLGNRSSGSDLVGIWEADDGEVSLNFTRKGRNALTLVMTSFEEDDPQALHYAIRPSRIEGKSYMSVMQYFPRESIASFADAEDISFREAKAQFARRDKRMNGYYFATYTISETDEGTVLKIALMDDDNDIVEEALEDGTLRGGELTVTNEEGEEDDIVYVTSSTRTLTSFVASHGDDPEALFDLELGDLVRKE